MSKDLKPTQQEALTAAPKTGALKSLTKDQLLAALETAMQEKSLIQTRFNIAKNIADSNNEIIQDIINIVEKHLSDLDLPRKFTFWWIMTNISTIAKLLKEIISYLKTVKTYKKGAVQG